MTQKQTDTPRLKSLDALRGFNIIFLCGLGALFAAVCQLSNVPWIYNLAAQTKHVEWVGLHAQDVIYPLFLFCVGNSIAFSIEGKLERGVSKKALIIKIIKRVIILSIIGLIFDGLLRDGYLKEGQSILGLIAVAYATTSFIVLYSKKWYTPIYWIFGILFFLTIIRFLFAAPGFNIGDFSKEGSINNYIDTFMFGYFDTEGIMQMISGTTCTLAGVLAGHIVKNQNFTQHKKLGILAGSGVAFLVLGMLANPWIPVVRRMFTVSFDLYTIGICILLFCLFYLVIDVWKYQRWAFFFEVIGMNTITIYLLSTFVDFYYTANWLVGSFTSMEDKFGRVIIFAVVLAIKWLLLYYLYKKKIFLRV